MMLVTMVIIIKAYVTAAAAGVATAAGMGAHGVFDLDAQQLVNVLLAVMCSARFRC